MLRLKLGGSKQARSRRSSMTRRHSPRTMHVALREDLASN